MNQATMNLKNPFSIETKHLFNHWACFICGSNGTRRGGLELHHITGRGSNSPFNGAVLCTPCHSRMGHNRGEERYLLAKTVQYLKGKGYKPKEEDWKFLEEHPHLIFDNEQLKKWLNSK